MPNVNGVLETALYVSDVQRAEEFYQRVFGFQPIHQEDDRLHALAVPGGQVLLLFRVGGSVQPTDTPGGRIPQHDGHGTLHLAFGINRLQVRVVVPARPVWFCHVSTSVSRNI